MLVGLVPLKLLGEGGDFRFFVVVLLLLEEFILVLPEGFKEFHLYHALWVPCCRHSVHPSFSNVSPGHHVHPDCRLLGDRSLDGM